MKRFIACLTVLLLIAACSTALAGKGNESKPVGNLGNPGVIPPQSKALGMTYAEWSVEWWQWIYSIPLSDNPWFQDERCDVGEQPRHVRFLAGKICMTFDPDQGCYADSTVVTRHCTIPPGTHLFFPVANAEADSVGIDPPLTPEELSSWVTSQYESTVSMSAEVDGVPVNGLSKPLTSPYRVKSDFFSYVVPEDNVIQVWIPDFPAGTIEPAIADGAFLMLAPLPVGEHTVRFGANFGTFSFLITYIITVTP